MAGQGKFTLGFRNVALFLLGGILLFVLVLFIVIRSDGYRPFARFPGDFTDAVVQMGTSGETFDLRSITDFEWDSAHFFPPYTSREEIMRCVGFDQEAAEDVAWRLANDVTSAVFFGENDVVKKWFLVSPSDPYIELKFDGCRIDASSAKFRVSKKISDNQIIFVITLVGG